jgi:hypothetical protein
VCVVTSLLPSALFDCTSDDQPLCAVQIGSVAFPGYGVSVSVSSTSGLSVGLSALESDPNPVSSKQIWFLEPV